MPIITTSMPGLTATFTRRIQTATGVSGTTAVGLPSIRPQLRLRPRPTHKTRKRATKPLVLLTVSARLQVRIPVPTARTAAAETSPAPAKTPPSSPAQDPQIPQALWANFKTMRARGSAAISSNKTVVAEEGRAQLKAAQTVAVHELASVKSPTGFGKDAPGQAARWISTIPTRRNQGHAIKNVEPKTAQGLDSTMEEAQRPPTNSPKKSNTREDRL